MKFARKVLFGKKCKEG